MRVWDELAMCVRSTAVFAGRRRSAQLCASNTATQICPFARRVRSVFNQFAAKIPSRLLAGGSAPIAFSYELRFRLLYYSPACQGHRSQPSDVILC